ncbi:MAG: leucine-rich repeat domain-containing protein [Clostridia bacterium]|nr:leucine-rich repeat domain-containing protein [Clostridia bacterium]
MEHDDKQKLFIYERGVSIMRKATTKQEYLEAVAYFGQIPDFNDSSELMTQCLELSKNAEKNEIYDRAIDAMRGDSEEDYRRALGLFCSIADWRDSESKAQLCRNRIQARINQRAKKKKIKIIVVTSIISAILLSAIITTVVVDTVLKSKYNSAERSFKNGKYAKAYELYDELDGYKDSIEKIEEIENECKKLAKDMAAKGEYGEAYELMTSVGMTAKDYPIINAYKYAMNKEYKNAVKAGLTEIIIPAGVTSISSDEFRDCQELKRITFPSTLETIGANAFYGCTSLQAVVFPEKCALKSIGANAFKNCSALQDITIPINVTTIGKGAFADCGGLKKIYFEFTGNWGITVEGEKIRFDSSEMADPTTAAVAVLMVNEEFALSRK